MRVCIYIYIIHIYIHEAPQQVGLRRRCHLPRPHLQGYLAHKKQPPPPRTTIGTLVQSYCRVLGEGSFT